MKLQKVLFNSNNKHRKGSKLQKGPKRTDKNRKGPKSTKKNRKDTEKDRKDTVKDRKDTEKDHNDTEKDTCTNLIPERRLYTIQVYFRVNRLVRCTLLEFILSTLKKDRCMYDCL